MLSMKIGTDKMYFRIGFWNSGNLLQYSKGQPGYFGEATDKREELPAIHEANMNRCKDILQGYLKIKESPKDFSMRRSA